MDKNGRVPRRTFQEEIFDELGQEICSGRFNPGDTLPAEPILCERFRVSRIVVREAIKSLAAKGIIEVRRKTGTVILPRDQWHLFDPDVIGWYAHSATIDQRFVADLMELRRVIEPTAARLAASRATETDREAIRNAFGRMAGSVGTNEAYVATDLAFHNAILTACHNQFLWQMHSALSVILQQSFIISARVPQGPRKSLSLHEDLCVSIEIGNPTAAEQAVLKLIERAESDLANAIAALPHEADTSILK